VKRLFKNKSFVSTQLCETMHRQSIVPEFLKNSSAEEELTEEDINVQRTLLDWLRRSRVSRMSRYMSANS
jgi:hypothetical protein